MQSHCAPDGSLMLDQCICSGSPIAPLSKVGVNEENPNRSAVRQFVQNLCVKCRLRVPQISAEKQSTRDARVLLSITGHLCETWEVRIRNDNDFLDLVSSFSSSSSSTSSSCSTSSSSSPSFPSCASSAQKSFHGTSSDRSRPPVEENLPAFISYSLSRSIHCAHPACGWPKCNG